MNQSMLATAIIALSLSGCATSQSDKYKEASFELCNGGVKTYSDSDDYTRVVCNDGAKFSLDGTTLNKMRDMSVNYCNGGTFGKFSESDNYYLFQCKTGEKISLKKD